MNLFTILLPTCHFVLDLRCYIIENECRKCTRKFASHSLLQSHSLHSHKQSSNQSNLFYLVHNLRCCIAINMTIIEILHRLTNSSNLEFIIHSLSRPQFPFSQNLCQCSKCLVSLSNACIHYIYIYI